MLRIKNFKAWQDSGEIRMAPLTLLFGANSAGKTSIAQLLLLLKQTAESPDRQRPLHFGDDRALIDLGDFQGSIHAHDPTQTLGVELTWRLSQKLQFTDAYAGDKYTVKALSFCAEVTGRGGAQPYVQRMEYALDTDNQDELRVGMKRMPDGKCRLEAHGYRPFHRQGRKWPLPPPTHFFGFPDEAVAYYQ